MPSVLVVDDDPHMVKTLCEILRLLGYEAHGASSGEEALAGARAQRWAAVVMDIRMPGLSGVDACKQLRALHPELPVILMTAHGDSHVLSEAAEAGALHVLSKPFPIPALLAALTPPSRGPRDASPHGRG